MANRLNMSLLATLMVVGAIFQASEAQTTHTVGGSSGWTIPSGGAATYATWASQQTFAVGDILVFNFAAGTHDVANVRKSAYDSCSTASPISTTTTAPAKITLSSAGEHYYICTFSGHCSAGQKLAVNVSAASTATSPSASTTPPATSTVPSSESPSGSMAPPPSSSATSLAAVALPVALLSFVLAFFN